MLKMHCVLLFFYHSTLSHLMNFTFPNLSTLRHTFNHVLLSGTPGGMRRLVFLFHASSTQLPPSPLASLPDTLYDSWLSMKAHTSRGHCMRTNESLIYVSILKGMFRPKNNGANLIFAAAIATELLRLTPALNTWSARRCVKVNSRINVWFGVVRVVDQL